MPVENPKKSFCFGQVLNIAHYHMGDQIDCVCGVEVTLDLGKGHTVKISGIAYDVNGRLEIQFFGSDYIYHELIIEEHYDGIIAYLYTLVELN